jgi:hypothetical protein
MNRNSPSFQFAGKPAAGGHDRLDLVPLGAEQKAEVNAVTFGARGR